jgi:Mg-chelatase subunit ChlD
MKLLDRVVATSTLVLAITGCSSAKHEAAGSSMAAAENSAPDMSDTAITTYDIAPAEAVATTGARSTTRTEVDIAGLIRTRTTTTTDEVGATATAPVPPVSVATSKPQSGLLTAGDHDDLLNPELYADYAERYLQNSGHPLPFVDTRTRVGVKVVDREGQPVPFAKVAVARHGSPLQLTTTADGVASYYPRFDRIPAATTITVSSAAGGATRTLSTMRGSRRIAIALPGTAQRITRMDLALVIDTTGSMGDEIAYLQAELNEIVARLRRDAGQIDLRIGLVVYRDEGDEYVVRSSPLTADLGSLRRTLARQEAGGGGDTPEAMDQAVAAVQRMQWRPNAAKAVLLVADAPPHEEGMASTLRSTQGLRAAGIQIVPVAASGVDDDAQYVLRTMATMTQGRYIFLTDDSGVGDAHAEPDLACYAVTRLDQLVARVLAGIMRGRRIEPAPAEIVRTVGSYDRGRCRTAGIVAGQG